MQSAFELPELQGRRVTVVGLGRFGGGIGAVQFLCRRGARVTLTDLLDERALADSLAELGGCPLQALHLGGHREADFTQADLIVASPAVSPDDRFLNAARHAGVPITSEMNLFWQCNRARVIGVTGTNGKSTTAALTDSMLRAGDVTCRFGGNIGRSLLPLVEEIEPHEWVVLELSSFQLANLDGIAARPDVAVVTSFRPNHLDRHRSVAAYRRAKRSIIRWQRHSDTAVLNADDPDVAGWKTTARRLGFGLTDTGGCGVFRSARGVVYRAETGDELLPIDKRLTLPGDHNLQNAMAAACAARAVGVPAEAVLHGLQHFEPLPHRMQFICEAAGRRFYNDSLATTPDSAVVAVKSFRKPVVLLAGGYDKQADLKELAAGIRKRAKAAALMGQTADKLSHLVARPSAKVSDYGGTDATDVRLERDSRPHRPHGQPLAVKKCTSLDEAFRWAVGQSAPGDVVLLSPGCASYDWFRDYRERGERFAELARTWCAAQPGAGCAARAR